MRNTMPHRLCIFVLLLDQLFNLSTFSACHMLWFLHLCTNAGVIVTVYQAEAKGTMEETANGGGRFTEVVLNPVAAVADLSMVEMANKLHEKAS
jgi:organic hydroperoxide reductase OsmC/OhrA